MLLDQRPHPKTLAVDSPKTTQITKNSPPNSTTPILPNSPTRLRPNSPTPYYPPMSLTYTHTLTVPPAAIDANGHVNNVVFVQWMQDAAIAHAAAVGCDTATAAHHALWVVRSHH